MRYLSFVLAATIAFAPFARADDGEVTQKLSQAFGGAQFSGSKPTDGQSPSYRASDNTIIWSTVGGTPVWSRSGTTLSPTTAGDSVSSPGAGSSSEKYGSGATAAGAQAASFGGTASGDYSTALGIGASTNGNASSIALGTNASNTAANQFVAGGSGKTISNIFFGDGPSGGQDYTFRGTTGPSGVGGLKISTDGTVTAIGALSIGQAGTTGILDIYGLASGKVRLTVPFAAGSATLTLPATLGSAGSALTDTAGNGTLAWTIPVTSVTGTTDQVVASGSTGAITLTLPQSINTTSTPQFAKLGIATAAASTAMINVAGTLSTSSGITNGLLINTAFNDAAGSFATTTGRGLSVTATWSFTGTASAAHGDLIFGNSLDSTAPNTNYLLRLQNQGVDRFTVTEAANMMATSLTGQSFATLAIASASNNNITINAGTGNIIATAKESTFAGQYVSTGYTCTTTLDWDNGNCQNITLANNGQTFTFAHPLTGGRYLIRLTQPASGAAGTVTWPTVRWPGGSPPTLTATNSQVDIVTFYYDGTSYFGGSSLNQ